MVKKSPRDLCELFFSINKNAQSKKTPIKSFLALPLKENYAFCLQNRQSV